MLALLAGCGYTTKSSLDPKYHTVGVAAFQNQSRQYDLQAPLTNTVIRKFITDGRLEVVDPGSGDLLIEGTITDYRLHGLIYDRHDEVTQFVCTITARVRVTDRSTGKPLWEDPKMVSETSFYTRALGQSSDRLRGNAQAFLPSVRSFPSDEENRGASEALEQLASDILYRTIEPW